jgi:hypothetical protein
VVQWLVATAAFVGLRAVEAERNAAEIAQIATALHLGVVGAFHATDVDGVARRWRGSTRLFSLLRPGALRGFRLTMILLGATTLGWVGFAAHEVVPETHLYAMIAAAAYVTLFLSIPLIITRVWKNPRLSTPTAGRAAIFLTAAVACSLPPLIGTFVSHPDEPGLNMFNPVVGFYNIIDGRSSGGALIFLCVVAAVAAVAADRVLAMRDRSGVSL